ncbi:hypothetical protein JKF63_00460 [Porcisia hertigi]|uniref:Protein kinase domain-containing protein n=1 Tax=Porcisia hertigi TaxID=2761500 RepID=A0A836L130_9TRYP|nr:hypothetical protein JKF63_00460 [Porcisia hertigi]
MALVHHEHESSTLPERKEGGAAKGDVDDTRLPSTAKRIQHWFSPQNDAGEAAGVEPTRSAEAASGSPPPLTHTLASQQNELTDIEGASCTYTLRKEIGRGAYGRVYLADAKVHPPRLLPPQQTPESVSRLPSLPNDLLTEAGSKGHIGSRSTSSRVIRVVLKRMENGSEGDGLQAATLREIMVLSEVGGGAANFDRVERDAFRFGRAVFHPSTAASLPPTRRHDNMFSSCMDQSRYSLGGATEDEWDEMISCSPRLPRGGVLDSRSAQQRRRIMRGHQHLIRILETLPRPREKLVYVAMEYCEGGDLWHFMRDLKISMRSSAAKFGDRMPPQVFRRWAVELILALSYLHSRNIVHRDLKPQNLMLAKRTDPTTPLLVSAVDSPDDSESRDTQGALPGELYTLKVGDFGLSRLEGIPYKKYVHEAVTLWYRSPDILLGNTNYTYSADAWSMGCILVEMASGSVLFKGKDEADELRHIFTRGCRPSLSTFPHMRDYHHSERYAEVLNRYQETDAENMTAEELMQMQVDRLSRHIRALLSERHSLELLGAAGVDLVARLLILDPERRLTVLEAMNHRFFTTAYAEVYGAD